MVLDFNEVDNRLSTASRLMKPIKAHSTLPRSSRRPARSRSSRIYPNVDRRKRILCAVHDSNQHSIANAPSSSAGNKWLISPRDIKTTLTLSWSIVFALMATSMNAFRATSRQLTPTSLSPCAQSPNCPIVTILSFSFTPPQIVIVVRSKSISHQCRTSLLLYPLTIIIWSTPLARKALVNAYLVGTIRFVTGQGKISQCVYAPTAFQNLLCLLERAFSSSRPTTTLHSAINSFAVR